MKARLQRLKWVILLLSCLLGEWTGNGAEIYMVNEDQYYNVAGLPQQKKMHLIVRRAEGESATGAESVKLRFSGEAIPFDSSRAVALYGMRYDIEGGFFGAHNPLTYTKVGQIGANSIWRAEGTVTIPAGLEMVALPLSFRDGTAFFSATQTAIVEMLSPNGFVVGNPVSGSMKRYKISVTTNPKPATVLPGGSITVRFIRHDHAQTWSTVSGLPAATVGYTYRISGGPKVSSTVAFTASSPAVDAVISVPSGTPPGALVVQVGSGADYLPAQTPHSLVPAGYVQAQERPGMAVITIGPATTVDSDFDGVSDYEEIDVFGTDPLSYDTDGDSLPDGMEIKYNFTPLVPNSFPDDGDGLDTPGEIANGSDPTKGDTDGDGVNDGTEAEQGSDPLDDEDYEPLPPSLFARVEVSLGDTSESASERYVLQVGPLGHSSRKPGSIFSQTYVFKRGKVYPFQLIHKESTLEVPDMDWTAGISLTAPSGISAHVYDPGTEPHDPTILGDHNTSLSTLPVAGKKGIFYIPLDESDNGVPRISVVPSSIEADGTSTAQGVVNPRHREVTWSIVSGPDDAVINPNTGLIKAGRKIGALVVRATDKHFPIDMGSSTAVLNITSLGDPKVTLHPPEIAANGNAKSKAYVNPSDRPVRWSIVEEGESALGCSIHEDTGDITCTNKIAGEVTVRATDKVTGEMGDAKLRLFCEGVPCIGPGCDEGGGLARNTSVDLAIGLGKINFGQTPVFFRLYEKQPNTARLFSPSALFVSAVSPEVETYYSGGEISQVKTPYILAVIADKTASGYAIKLYHNFQLESHAPGNPYVVKSGEQPFCTWTLSQFQSGSPHLLVKELRGGKEYRHLYEYIGVSGVHHNWNLKTEWTASDGYRRQERRVRSGNVETYTVSDISGSEQILHIETRTFNAANEIEEELIGTGPNPRRTVWQYYGGSAPAGSQGKLQYMTNNLGWELYHYDSQGRTNRIVSQEGNNLVTSSEVLNRVKTINLFWDNGFLVEETQVKVNGFEISHRYDAIGKELIGGINFDVQKVIKCQEKGVTSMTALGNLTTTTYLYPAGHTFAYQTNKVIKGDGTLITFTPVKSEDNPPRLTTTVDEGEPNSGFTQVINGLRTENAVDASGNFVSVKSYAIQSGQSPLFLRQTLGSDFGENGRPQTFTYDDGSTELLEYGCCGLDSYTDRAGVQILYLQDAMKRVEWEIGPETKLHYVYDAAGRLDYVERMAADGSGTVIRLRDYAYDNASRIVSVIEPAVNGTANTTGTTTFNFSIDSMRQTVITTTYPNQSTRRSVFAQNGRPVRVDGTAVSPIEYEHGADADGEFIKRIYIRGSGSSQQRDEWQKSSFDMLDRPWKETLPSFNGRPQATMTGKYSSVSGREISSTDEDGVVTLYEYDGKGELIREAFDMNGNGRIDEGVDRVFDLTATWTSWTPPGSATAIPARRRISREWKTVVSALNNPSFDSGSVGSLSDWTGSGGFGARTPSEADYPGTTILGSKAGYLNVGSISQGNVATIAANRRYRLRGRVGSPAGSTVPTVVVKFKSGSTVLLSHAVTGIPIGKFQEFEAVHQVPSGQVTGQLTLEIEASGAGSVDLDAFEFYAADLVESEVTFGAASGDLAADVRNGVTNTIKTAYSPGEGKRIETITQPDNSTFVSEYINGRLRYEMLKSSPTPATVLAQTEYQYDGHGRMNNVVVTRDGTTATTTYTHYQDGRLASILTPSPGLGNPDRLLTQYAYQDLATDGGLTTVTLPDSSAIQYKYYLTGDLRKESGSQTTPAEYTYDEQGRVKTMTTWREADDSSTATVIGFQYDTARGFLTSKTVNGTGTTYDYFDSGRLKRRTWQRGVYTDYLYDSAGNLSSKNYSDTTLNPDVTFTYDGRNLLSSATDSTGTHSYLHAADGQLEQELHESGVLAGLSVRRRYNGYNKVDNIMVKMGALTTVFDQNLGYKNGSLIDHVSANGYYVTYDYVPGTIVPKTITYRVGTSYSTSDPEFKTTRTHDALNRLRTLTNSVGGIPRSSYEVSYNRLGQKTSIKHGDDSRWDYGHDAHGNLESARKRWADDSPVAGQQYTYHYDDEGNRTHTTRDGKEGATRVVNYAPAGIHHYASRDALGYVNVIGRANADAKVTVNDQVSERKGAYFRAEVAAPPGTGPVNHTVTVRGARVEITLTETNNVMATAEFQTTVPRGAQSFDYDEDGNLTADGVWTFTWNAENRLAIAEHPGHKKLTFDYDYMGRRVRKSVQTWTSGSYSSPVITCFIYNGQHLVAEMEEYLVLKRGYVWGLTEGGLLDADTGEGALAMIYTPSSTAVHFVTQDASGNVASLVNAATLAIEAQYEYSPFGEPIMSSGPLASSFPIRYANRYWDEETQLTYFGHRYYSPSQGRWLSRDPVGELDGLNPYKFVHNDPTGYVDPDGLQARNTNYTPRDAWEILKEGAKNIHWMSAPNAARRKIDDVSGALGRASVPGEIPKMAGEIAQGLKDAKDLGKLLASNECVRNTLKRDLGKELQEKLNDPEALGEALSGLGIEALMAAMGAGALDPASDLGKLLRGIQKCTPKNGRCFVAGTLVLTEEGLRPIEEIKEGDLVWAWNEETGEAGLRAVIHSFFHQVHELVVMQIGEEDIVTTKDHPFWVEGKGWVNAGKLKVGDFVRTRQGKPLTIAGVRSTNEIVFVYNFEVQGWHNYYVTKAEILVHNDCWSRDPKSIQDQMALEAAKKGAGTKLIDNLGDPKFKGMEKWEYKVKSNEGRDSVVHYVRDPATGNLMDFKFKKHSIDEPTDWERMREPEVGNGTERKKR